MAVKSDPRESKPFDPTSDPLSDRMLQLLREARESTGMSLEEVSKALGGEFSASYLSLMLRARRAPKPKAIEGMARLFGLGAQELDALHQWSLLMNRYRSSSQDLLQAARKLEKEHPDLVVRVPKGDQLGLSDSGSREKKKRPSKASASEHIPVVEDGLIPDSLESARAPKHVHLDSSLLQSGDTLCDPFAWRVGVKSVERVSDLLREGDLLVLSRMKPPYAFGPHDLWLVEMDGKPILTRVVKDGELLVLPGPPGTDAGPMILRSGPSGNLQDHVKAKVVASIRSWPPYGNTTR